MSFLLSIWDFAKRLFDVEGKAMERAPGSQVGAAIQKRRNSKGL